MACRSTFRIFRLVDARKNVMHVNLINEAKIGL